MENKMENKMTADEFVKLLNEKYSKANIENELKAVSAKSKDYYEGYNMAIHQMKEAFSIDLYLFNTIKEKTTTCILNNLEMVVKNESKVDKDTFSELVTALDELNSAVHSIRNAEKNISILDKLSNNLLPPESK